MSQIIIMVTLSQTFMYKSQGVKTSDSYSMSQIITDSNTESDFYVQIISRSKNLRFTFNIFHVTLRLTFMS